MQLQQTAQETRDSSGNVGVGASKTNKCHIRVVPSARQSPAVKKALGTTRRLILKDGLVKLSAADEANPPHHLVTAYMLPFPNKSYDGLVTTIDDMNMLNWVYVDSETYRVTYGVRVKAEQEITGPVGLTLMAEGAGSKITLDGWDGFMAVEDKDGDWTLYFDKDSDGLSGKIDESKAQQVAQVELHREMLE